MRKSTFVTTEYSTVFFESVFSLNFAAFMELINLDNSLLRWVFLADLAGFSSSTAIRNNGR